MFKHLLKSEVGHLNRTLKVSLSHLMSVSSSTMRSQSALGTASLRKRFKMANVFPQCPSIRQEKKKKTSLEALQATKHYNTVATVRKQLHNVHLLMGER